MSESNSSFLSAFQTSYSVHHNLTAHSLKQHENGNVHENQHKHQNNFSGKNINYGTYWNWLIWLNWNTSQNRYINRPCCSIKTICIITSLRELELLTMEAKTLHDDSHSPGLSMCNTKAAILQLCKGMVLSLGSSPISSSTSGQTSINSCRAWQAACKTSGLSQWLVMALYTSVVHM